MKEDDIRKRDIFNKYIRIIEKDIESLLDVASFKYSKCPACNSAEYDKAFTKAGFDYVLCPKCGTLFANPRPSIADMGRFYSGSASSIFWMKYFFNPVAETRREKIFKPRAQFVKDLFPNTTECIIGDIGAGFGIFLEEMRNIWTKGEYIAIEPSLEQADICRDKGLKVETHMLEQLDGYDGYFDILFAFELFEHILNPALFLKNVYEKLKPGGYFFMTTLNGEGFDIATLWDKSKSVFPPHHLNFFNIDSACLLFKNSGFDIINTSTPGVLDWDIVEGMFKQESVEIPRFFKLLANKGTDKAKNDFQNWLSSSNMSSHMRIIVKKPI
jgi:SAM-dependent methyltransferase